MFAKRLKSLRLSNKMTQEDVAKILGITRQGYGHYENPKSKREPDHETTIKLAKIFDVSVDYLLNGPGGSYGLDDYDFTDNSKKDNKVKNESPFSEINNLMKNAGIEDSGFFDIEEWKNLSPEDMIEIKKHFEWVAQKAKERNKDKNT